MGYDLHITRADDWTESAGVPIAYDEWLVYASTVGGLAAEGALSLAGAGHEAIEQDTFVMDGGPSLHWWEGEVVVSGADEQHVDALRPIAIGLGAQLQGDDGELY